MLVDPMASESPETIPKHEGVPILRVGQLVLMVRDLLEQAIPDVWVEGEVIESRRASSGHHYFTLADGASEAARRARTPDAQLKCIVFLSDQAQLQASIEMGARLRVRGRAGVFAQQSSLQLVVSQAVVAGVGDRAEKLAQLRAKLRNEGLFDPARKRKLPRFPRVVGLVTSKKGAALHDVISVARRRFPVRIVVAHCTVQGPDAARSIVAGLEALSRLPGIDVVILARGGGASEDLSAFDDERVVRAVASFPVPVVSGVGHEVDVTLTDLVADLRAATPSNAAELVVPDRETLRGELRLLLRRLQARFEGRIQSARLRLERQSARLASRRGSLRARREGLRAIERTLERGMRRRIDADRRRVGSLAERLAKSDPRRAMARARGELARLSPRLAAGATARLTKLRAERLDAADRIERAARQRIAGGRHELAVLVGRLDALSPLAVLSRGYAIAIDPRGRAILRAGDVAVGEVIEVRVERGTLAARVERADDEPT